MLASQTPPGDILAWPPTSVSPLSLGFFTKREILMLSTLLNCYRIQRVDHLWVFSLYLLCLHNCDLMLYSHPMFIKHSAHSLASG